VRTRVVTMRRRQAGMAMIQRMMRVEVRVPMIFSVG